MTTGRINQISRLLFLADWLHSRSCRPAPLNKQALSTTRGTRQLTSFPSLHTILALSNAICHHMDTQANQEATPNKSRSNPQTGSYSSCTSAIHFYSCLLFSFFPSHIDPAMLFRRSHQKSRIMLFIQPHFDGFLKILISFLEKHPNYHVIALPFQKL